MLPAARRAQRGAQGVSGGPRPSNAGEHSPEAKRFSCRARGGRARSPLLLTRLSLIKPERAMSFPIIHPKAPGPALGIDEAMIRRLVHAFYAEVRTDPALGPIFNGRITD